MNYSEFYKEILEAGKAVIDRDIEFSGIKKKVYFVRITAKERLDLQPKGYMTQGSIPISMADLKEQRMKLVRFSNVDAEGNKLFKTLDDVGKIPDHVLDLLYRHADEINKEGEEAGKQP